MKKIPLIVSFSAFMDETAAMAHYILPNHIYLERFEDVPAAQGFPKPVIGLVKPVVRPLFNTRHTGDAVIQLAKAVGGTVTAAFGWESYEACLQESLGDKWDALKEEGYWIDAKFNTAAFETKSKKFEFANATSPAVTSRWFRTRPSRRSSTRPASSWRNATPPRRNAKPRAASWTASTR